MFYTLDAPLTIVLLHPFSLCDPFARSGKNAMLTKKGACTLIWKRLSQSLGSCDSNTCFEYSSTESFLSSDGLAAPEASAVLLPGCVGPGEPALLGRASARERKERRREGEKKRAMWGRERERDVEVVEVEVEVI